MVFGCKTWQSGFGTLRINAPRCHMKQQYPLYSCYFTYLNIRKFLIKFAASARTMIKSYRLMEMGFLSLSLAKWAYDPDGKWIEIDDHRFKNSFDVIGTLIPVDSHNY